MTDLKAKYIVVEGPIGVGKTSISRLLAQKLDARLISEEIDGNPFLKDFYKSERKNAFSTQLFFLLSRYKQQQQLLKTDLFQKHIVADYIFHKDLIFAELNLNEEEKKLYYQIFALLKKDVLKPSVVVFLYASVDELYRRIKKRNLKFEEKLSKEYLGEVYQSYLNFFYDYKDSPLIMVNVDGIDPINNLNDRQELFNAILNAEGGRSYYNPPKGLLNI